MMGCDMRRAVPLAVAVLALTVSPAPAKSFKELFGDNKYADAADQSFVESLDYQQGAIELPAAQTKLTLPAGFYFLSTKDAVRVLVEAWKNPPSAGNGTLGMIFPADVTPIDGAAWGAQITFESDGYVSDEDAAAINYDDLLSDMKASTVESSKQRVEQGFAPIELIGWASPPYYDSAAHKLHWAKELKFGTEDAHTLNYNVRVLGRHGVLNINFIAGMNQVDQIKAAIPAVMTMAEFEYGARYADYVPGTDKLAAYGIAGLISGVVLKKVGLLGLALVFLQKFWFLGIAAVAGVFTVVRRLVTRQPPQA